MSARRTDDEVMALLRGDSALNRARAIFSGESGRIEQALAQRQRGGIIDVRRMEFEAVEKIASALAVPELYEALDECMKEHGGFVIKGQVERRARAALSLAREPSNPGEKS
ncbi:MAG: hypothetical protein Q8R92_01065 [Deltaproteobacteria bacterium]|nr:hypothetical protein [Deltaproteobacteria bacterium]